MNKRILQQAGFGAFSPLSIGSLSVTTVFLFITVEMMRTFSPLSIGSLSVTIMPYLLEGMLIAVFQSPFYRVFECNSMVSRLTSPGLGKLSVPFLSGL